MRLKVPYIDQSIKYPTGCESVSTVMLLQYLGYSITVDELIEQYLEKDFFEDRNGELYGPDPREAFCGSPYDEASFGCYAPVIVKALNRFFCSEKAAEENKKQYEAIDMTGWTAEELTEKYVRNGMPVIFWACINMREPVTGPEWKLKKTSEMFTWISNEHCMLLTGVDKEGFWFHDPYENHGEICYPRELTEDRHKAQLMQAVAVREKETAKKDETI